MGLKRIYRKGLLTKILSSASVMLLLVVVSFPVTVAALPGAHSGVVGGEVFLGGNYIELGLAASGSFGTNAAAPAGFYGTAARSNVGMSTNPAGFGESPDLRMDYFLPGSPRERWVAGYKKSGTPTIGKNGTLSGYTEIPNTVTNMSSGDNLSARSVGTLGGELQVTQDITFKVNDKYFLNTITFKNVGSVNLDSVRYARSFDPDNTKDKGGQYSTHNEILYTNEAGDGKAVVLADTSPYNSDPVYLANGSRSPIVYYSSSPSAKVSISNNSGYDGIDPYDVDLYDSADSKGTFVDSDTEINIAFDVGTLAPNQTKTVSYYTSLDNRDFSEVIEDIAEDETDDGDNITAEIENAAPNSGDGNGDGIADSTQANVTSIPNTATSKSDDYATVSSTGCDSITSIAINSVDTYGSDDGYEYPVGLADFTLRCASPGDTATIKIYYDQEYDTSSWVARKYMNGSFQTISGAVFGTATVGSNTVTTLTYSVTDGGVLDADGVANGTIVDPAGPAVSASGVGVEVAESGTLADTGMNNLLTQLFAISIVCLGVGLRYRASRAMRARAG